MTMKTETPARLQEAVETAERQRGELLELGEQLNARGLQVEAAQAAERAALDAAAEATARFANQKTVAEELAGQLDLEVAAKNVATERAAEATSRAVAAEDAVNRLAPLYDQERLAVERLEAENAALAEKVAAFSSRVATFEGSLAALVAHAKEAVGWLAGAAVEWQVVVNDDPAQLAQAQQHVEERAGLIRRRTAEATTRLNEDAARTLAALTD